MDGRALDVLSQVLPPMLRAAAHVGDGELLFESSGDPTALRPIWVGEGLPHDLETILRRGDADDPEVVLVARAFSRGARTRLEREGRSWADATGRIHIAAPGVYVAIDSAGRHPTKVPGVKGWSPAVGAVAETLLYRATDFGGDQLSLPRLAEMAAWSDYSLPIVTRALQAFDEEGFTRKTGGERGATAGRELIDPSGLLSAWAGWHRRRRMPRRSYYLFERDLRDAARRHVFEAAHDYPWAYTGWVAADVMAPLSSQIPTISVYVPEELSDHEIDVAAGRLGAEPAEPNEARIHVLSAPQYLFRAVRSVKGMPTAPPVRVYADLLASGVRGDAAAEHLREHVLGW